MTARHRHRIYAALALGLVLWFTDYMLRAIGEAARHGSWDGSNR